MEDGDLMHLFLYCTFFLVTRTLRSFDYCTPYHPSRDYLLSQHSSIQLSVPLIFFSLNLGRHSLSVWVASRVIKTLFIQDVGISMANKVLDMVKFNQLILPLLVLLKAVGNSKWIRNSVQFLFFFNLFFPRFQFPSSSFLFFFF